MASYFGLLFLVISLVSGLFAFDGGDPLVAKWAETVFTASLPLGAVSLFFGALNPSWGSAGNHDRKSRDGDLTLN